MSDPLPPPQLPGVLPVEPPVTTIDVINLTPAPPGAGPATITLPDGTRLIQGPDGEFVAYTAPPSPSPVAVHAVLSFKGLLATLATLSAVAIVAVAVTRNDDPPITVPTMTTIAAVTVPPVGATIPTAAVPTTALPDPSVPPSTAVATDGGPAIALIVSTIDYCLSLTTFTDAERVQVKGELSFSAVPAATPDLWIVTITNAAEGRDGEWTVDLATGDITPVMPFGADSIYFDMQWCMHSNTLGVG